MMDFSKKEPGAQSVREIITTDLLGDVCRLDQIPLSKKAWQQIGYRSHFMILRRHAHSPGYELDTCGLHTVINPSGFYRLQIERLEGGPPTSRTVREAGFNILLTPGRYRLEAWCDNPLAWETKVLAFDAAALLPWYQMGFFLIDWDFNQGNSNIRKQQESMYCFRCPSRLDMCSAPHFILLSIIQRHCGNLPEGYFHRFLGDCLGDSFTAEEIGPNPFEEISYPTEIFCKKALEGRYQGKLPHTAQALLPLVNEIACQEIAQRYLKAQGGIYRCPFPATQLP